MTASKRWGGVGLAVVVFVVAVVLYGVPATLTGRTMPLENGYFDKLAEAFLQGRTYVVGTLSNHDLTRYNGQWYVPFPPLPAILMLPSVALRGHVNTIHFSVIMGALNVALVFLLLQALAARGWTKLSVADNLWLTALFGLSTVHWYIAAVGTVWFVSQICTVTFMALAVWLMVRTGSPWLAGAALGLAMWARPNVVLLFPLLGAMALRQAQERALPLAKTLVRWTLCAAVPLVGAVAALLWYNWVRFANPLDFGYLTENVAQKLADDLRRYGQFNLYYVSRNLRAMLLALPVWNAKQGMLLPNGEGLSLLITTPALVYLVLARRADAVTVGAWVAVVALLLPLLTYYNTGWYQFGYRFSLDFIIPLVVLLALGVRERVPGLMRALIGVGVLVNAWGVTWFLGLLAR
jgi:hypothetical protein